MATTNDITGDALVSKPATEKYRDSYDLIFNKGKKPSDSKNKTDGAIVPSSERVLETLLEVSGQFFYLGLIDGPRKKQKVLLEPLV